MTDPNIKSDQSSNPAELNGLKIGTRIGEFEVVKRLGEGGFSVVYLAMDHSLERHVALKEYMPMSIASRVDNTQIAPMTERHRETFDVALASFINEGKLLAQFDHPALVKVYRFWEANGTAYMVMPFYEGRTLRDTIRALDQPPDEAWFVAMLQPLTKALTVIHDAKCYHRDIAPDNVMLLAPSGKPLLLDFGAARRVVGDKTQALTAILKPGYAPIEQYAEVPHLRQGAWTDVYALAAVMYWAIKGSTPPSSVGRMMKDSYVPLAESAAERYSQRFLKAIDNALKVLPEDRTQNVDAFRLDMGLEDAPAEPVSVLVDSEATILRPSTKRAPPAPSDATVFSAIPGSGPATTGLSDKPAEKSTEQPAQQVSAPAAAEPGGITAFMASPTPPAVAAEEAKPVSAPVAASRPMPMMLGMAATGLVVVGAGLWWWLQQPQPPVAEIATAPTTPIAQPTPAPPPIETPIVAAAPPPVPAPVVKAEVRPPIEVETAGLSSPFELGKKPLEFAVTANAAGFLYVFGRHEKDGQLQLLLPDKKNQAIELVAGKSHEVSLPAKALAEQPPGSWQLWVLAARARQELNATDWSKQGARIKSKFDPAASANGQYWIELLCPAKADCEGEFGMRKLALATEAVPRPAPKPVVTAPPVVAKPAPAPAPAPRQEPVRAAATRPAPAPAPAAPAPAAQPAECARLIQRLSLGSGGSELIARMQALGCR